MKKKILATALCASMVLSSTAVFAADTTTSTGTGNSTGDGKVEGVLDKEVYSVTLPTVAEKTYDFILDPQDLISQTNNEAYSGAAFNGDTGMYFQTASNQYTEKSAAQTVVNKSAVDIDLTMDVKVDMDSVAGISIEEAASLTSTTPSINLALVGTLNGGDEDDPVYVGADGELSKTVKLDNDAADYTAVYETSTYVYKNTESDHDDSQYEFYLTGAANKGAKVDWTDVKDKTPSITVTWSYAKHVEGPQVVVTKNDGAKTMNVSITSLTADKAFTSMTMSDGTNTYDYDAVPSAVTKTGNDSSAVTIALSSAWYDGFAGKTVTFTVTLSDGTTVVANLSLAS